MESHNNTKFIQKKKGEKEQGTDMTSKKQIAR